MTITPDNSLTNNPLSDKKPTLSAEDEQRLFLAAGRRVASAVQMSTPESLDKTLAHTAHLPVYGAFVSLSATANCVRAAGISVLGQPWPRQSLTPPTGPPPTIPAFRLSSPANWIIWIWKSGSCGDRKKSPPGANCACRK